MSGASQMLEDLAWARTDADLAAVDAAIASGHYNTANPQPVPFPCWRQVEEAPWYARDLLAQYCRAHDTLGWAMPAGFLFDWEVDAWGRQGPRPSIANARDDMEALAACFKSPTVSGCRSALLSMGRVPVPPAAAPPAERPVFDDFEYSPPFGTVEYDAWVARKENTDGDGLVAVLALLALLA